MHIPELPQRRSIRLYQYDYSQDGAYFITICTHHHQCLFGKIVNERMELNDLGKIVQDEWLKTAKVRSNIIIDTFIFMPNHLHGIIC